MRHVLVFAAFAAAIAFFATRKSDVDRLMVPVKVYSAQQVGNQFVNLDPRVLPVTPQFLAVRGVTTIVYFHDKTCANCIKMDQDIDDLLRLRPDVAVRKVSISVEGDAYYKAIRDFQWKVYMSPSVIIFDPQRKLVAADEGTDDTASELLYAWMRKESEQAAAGAAER
jgi:hypothetical protein